MKLIALSVLIMGNAQALSFSMLDQSVSQNISECVVKEVYRDLKRDIIIKRHKSIYTLPLVDLGRYDGEVSRVKNDDHKNVIRIDVPIFTLKAMAFHKKNNPVEISDFDSLRSYTVAVNEGALFSKKPDGFYKRVYKLNSYQKALEMVNLGRADVALVNYSNGVELMNRFNYIDLIPHESVLKSIPMYHYLHKRHAALADKVKKELTQMKKSGRLDKIHQQYMKKLEKETKANTGGDAPAVIECP